MARPRAKTARSQSSSRPAAGRFFCRAQSHRSLIQQAAAVHAGVRLPLLPRRSFAWHSAHVQEQHGELTPEQKQILVDIAEVGVHIVHVQKSAAWPLHSYSVGLTHSFQQPEVIVFGLPADAATSLIDSVADEAGDGRRFEPGSQHDGLLHNYPVRFATVSSARVAELMPKAAWANGGDVAAVQLVWPDKQGRWPWQDDVREKFAGLQPVLERFASEV